MVQSAIAQVFEFISQNRGYRANMGVVVSKAAQQTVLCWAAVKGQDFYVPELESYQRRWPDAVWIPLSEQQARLFDHAWEQQQRPQEDSVNRSFMH